MRLSCSRMIDGRAPPDDGRSGRHITFGSLTNASTVGYDGCSLQLCSRSPMQLRHTGSSATGSFPARLRLTIRRSWTNWYFRPCRASSIRAKVRMSRMTASAGRSRGCSHRRFPSESRADGFTETGESPSTRDSTRPRFTLKDLLYKSKLHEVLISAGLAWGIGHSGAQGVGASKPDTIQPSNSASASNSSLRVRRYSLDSPGKWTFGSRSTSRHLFMSRGLPLRAIVSILLPIFDEPCVGLAARSRNVI